MRSSASDAGNVTAWRSLKLRWLRGGVVVFWTWATNCENWVNVTWALKTRAAQHTLGWTNKQAFYQTTHTHHHAQSSKKEKKILTQLRKKAWIKIMIKMEAEGNRKQIWRQMFAAVDWCWKSGFILKETWIIWLHCEIYYTKCTEEGLGEK